MKKLWWVGLAVITCACRREEAPAPRPVTALVQKPAATDSRPVIACFGDSLTAGFGVDEGKSYPDLLQRDLDEAGYHYRVVNFGVSGDTTQDGVSRLLLVIAEHPRFVVLEFGANDGLRGQPVTVAAANLGQMVEAFHTAGARVVLAGITLPPNYGPEYIRKFNGMYTDLAAKYMLPFVPFLLDGAAGNVRLMQSDGLHPNAEGTRLMEKNVMRVLQPLLIKE
jgi:acyl-CoA thioesterase-1